MTAPRKTDARRGASTSPRVNDGGEELHERRVLISPEHAAKARRLAGDGTRARFSALVHSLMLAADRPTPAEPGDE